MAKGHVYFGDAPEDASPAKASTSKVSASASPAAAAASPQVNGKAAPSPKINGATHGHKKPKVVHMRHSDSEDDAPSTLRSPKKKKRKSSSGLLNGVNGKAGKEKGKGAGKGRVVVDEAQRDKLLKGRMELPIWAGKDALVSAIRENDFTIILGETGSGKTTQVPQFLHSASLTPLQIGITQPRRVAATSLASRVAQETGTPLGSLVGYTVRFEDATSPATRIKYLTDGMLVRELLGDADLGKYGVLVVDEAHERTLRTDMVLGTLKAIVKRRKEKGMERLRVVVMSATLDAERFSRFFDDAPVLYVRGRQHSVQIYNSQSPISDYLDGALKTVFQIHTSTPAPGDILVFLPGQESILSLLSSIQLHAKALPADRQLLVLPLYASLAPAQQARVFVPAPKGVRKVILATNIAETSITIPGVRFVVDSGLGRERDWISRHGGTGIDSLLIKPVSKSSAMQRAGRAGREAPGTCFRLYTEETYLSLRTSAVPEIQRCNLTFAVLQLKALGEETFHSFEWMDEPEEDALHSALILLYGLRALDKSSRITPLGFRMSTFPLDPPLARALLASAEHNCLSPMVDLCALLSSESPWADTGSPRDDESSSSAARKRFAHRDGDHFALLNVLRAFEDVLASSASAGGEKAHVREWCKMNHLTERNLRRTLEVRAQLRQMCAREGLDWRQGGKDDDSEPVLRSLLEGMFQNVALLQPDGSYKQALGNQPVKIHPGSLLHLHKVPGIIYHEVVLTTNTYARIVSSIHPAWLDGVAFFSERSAD